MKFKSPIHADEQRPKPEVDEDPTNMTGVQQFIYLYEPLLGTMPGDLEITRLVQLAKAVQADLEQIQSKM